jgi:hypothetical protein
MNWCNGIRVPEDEVTQRLKLWRPVAASVVVEAPTLHWPWRRDDAASARHAAVSQAHRGAGTIIRAEAAYYQRRWRWLWLLLRQQLELTSHRRNVH